MSKAGTESTRWLVRNKDAFAAAQSLFTIAALLTAGIWFLFQHQWGPRLRVEHHISHMPSTRVPGKILIGMDVTLLNVGNVSVTIHCGDLALFDVDVLESDESYKQLWPLQSNSCLDDLYVEAGEPEVVHKDILIDASVKTIMLHSFFKNPREGKIGSDTKTLHDLTVVTAEPSTSSQRANPVSY